MIKTRIINDVTGTRQLCETYSTEIFKLKQVETGIIYGSSVVDIVSGYDEQGSPYSRFTYIETGEYDGEVDETTQKAQAYDILMGVTE